MYKKLVSLVLLNMISYSEAIKINGYLNQMDSNDSKDEYSSIVDEETTSQEREV